MAPCPPSPTSQHSHHRTHPLPNSETSTSPAADKTPDDDKDHDDSLCIICMNNPKDVTVYPCTHIHSCLACLYRSARPHCPVCRRPILALTPFNTKQILPPPTPPSPPTVLPHLPNTYLPSRRHAPPHHLHPTYTNLLPAPRRRNPTYSQLSSSPSFPPLNPTPSPSTFSPSFSALSISPPQTHLPTSRLVPTARQAAPSVRPLPTRARAVLAQLRTTGSTLPLSPTAALTTPMPPPPSPLEAPLESVILLGPSRKLLLPLARQILRTFPLPSPPSTSANPSTPQSSQPLKSCIHVDGRNLRLVLMEFPPSSMRLQLATRVERHFPRLILLCSHFDYISEFETAVRLDIDILDYLNVPIIWAFLHTPAPTLAPPCLLRRRNAANAIEDSDIRAAKHFITTPRPVVSILLTGTRCCPTSIRKLTRQISTYLSQHRPRLSNQRRSPRRNWASISPMRLSRSPSLSFLKDALASTTAKSNISPIRMNLNLDSCLRPLRRISQNESGDHFCSYEEEQ